MTVVGRWQVDPRVCEVAALPSPDAAEGSVGSGVLLGSGRLLTARHVVAPAEFEAAAWMFRPLGTAEWVPSGRPTCATSGDLAVLALPPDGELPVGVDPPRLGRLASAEEQAARAVGFPGALRCI
jgi:S1-C subfamily serine protease